MQSAIIAAAAFTSIALLVCIQASIPKFRHRHKKETEREESLLPPDNNIRCSKPIPGIEWFNYGFDLTSVDLFSCPNVTGMKRQIFDFNVCNQRKSVHVTDLVGTFDCPDDFIVLVQRSKGIDEDEIFDTLEEIKSDLFSVIDAEQIYDKGIFSRSEYYSRFQNDLRNYTFVATSRSEELYSIDPQYYSLNQYMVRTFRRDYTSLPNTFEGNVDKYIQFIKDYGTHYLKSAQFGGQMRRIVAFDRNKLNFSYADMIAKARSLNFHIFDENSFVGYHKSNKWDKNVELCMDKAERVGIFRNDLYDDEYAFVEQHNFGGKANKMRYEAWAKSIWRGVYITGMFLRPISMLVGGQREKEIEKAIKAYIADGYLDELSNDLIYKLNTGVDEKHEEFINQCLIKVNESRIYNPYNLTAINMLIDEIENGLLPGPPEPITKGESAVISRPSIGVQLLPFLVVFVTICV